jgi:hypothetical protein
MDLMRSTMGILLAIALAFEDAMRDRRLDDTGARGGFGAKSREVRDSNENDLP